MGGKLSPAQQLRHSNREKESCIGGGRISRFAPLGLCLQLYVFAAVLAPIESITGAQTTPTSPSASRLMVGDAAIEIRDAPDAQLRVAVADSDKVLVITVLARDARRWGDSVSKILRAKAPSRRVPKEWTAILEEPGLQSGSMSVTRRDGQAGTQWSLYVANRDFDEIRIGMDAGEVRGLVAAIRRRAAAASPPKPSRARKRPNANSLALQSDHRIDLGRATSGQVTGDTGHHGQ
jgi:hypothetical protein